MPIHGWRQSAGVRMHVPMCALDLMQTPSLQDMTSGIKLRSKPGGSSNRELSLDRASWVRHRASWHRASWHRHHGIGHHGIGIMA